jgi:L-erythro-3,5-diaminohexanoate dehydrogenase
MMQGHQFGCHRVLEPQGSLPQPAWKLAAGLPLYDNELMLDIEALNIDSASFQQLKEEANGQSEQLKRLIMNIVGERGKMHNPVTGSGGMLIGSVKQVGAAYPHALQAGDRLASLVSLTLTPLQLEEILEINMQTGQVQARGHAILFESCPFARLPGDLPDALSLAVLDVCGAPAQVERLVNAGDTVVVLGAGGKSGLLSVAQARKSAGPDGLVIAVEYEAANVNALEELQLADLVLQGDARDSLNVYTRIEQETGGRLADVVVNCVNVPHTEMTTILCTKQNGTAYFFSMATSFTAAALGAEGVGKDIRLMIGNGYAQGHADLTLSLVRESAPLRAFFERKYAKELKA